MAAFFKHPPRSRQPPEANATPLGRGRILSHAEMNNRAVHDNFVSPPLLFPDDFVLRSSNNVTGTSGLILPKFWDGDADLYFLKIETIFRVRGINSEQSKLDSLLAALDLRHFRFLEHVLPDLNAQYAYSKTKSVLLLHFAPSSDDKLKRFLNGSRLSDRTSPSRLLAKMRSLLGESGSQDRLLRKLVLDCLPAGVCRIIVSHPVEDLDQLAKIADRVMVWRRTVNVHQVLVMDSSIMITHHQLAPLMSVYQHCTILSQTLHRLSPHLHILSGPCHAHHIIFQTLGITMPRSLLSPNVHQLQETPRHLALPLL